MNFYLVEIWKNKVIDTISIDLTGFQMQSKIANKVILILIHCSSLSINVLTTSVHASAIFFWLYPPPPNAIIFPSQYLCDSRCNLSAAYLCDFEVYFKCVNGSPLMQSAPHCRIINSGFADRQGILRLYWMQ